MKKYLFMLAAVIFSIQLKAQLVPAFQDDTTGTSLDEVIITANKYEKKQSESGKVVTVISRQQLDESGGKTLNELLNTVVGTIIIGANNNLGTNQTASIRGASAGNVLILIDGVPANDPSVITNYFDLNFINAEQVEKIEILKGGQSTLYGSDAVAGVINIISRRPGVKKINVNGNFSIGSYYTMKQSVGINGNKVNTDYSINYTHLGSNGFSSAYDSNKTGTFDKDAFNQHIVNGHFGFNAGKRIRISLLGSFSNYDTDLDVSAFTDDKDFTAKNSNVQAGAGVTYIYKKGTVRVNYSYNQSERKYLDDSIYKSSPFIDYTKSSYTGRTHFAEFYGNWKIKNWEILAGTDYRSNYTEQNYFSYGPYGPYAPPVLKAEMNQISPYMSLFFKNNHGLNLETGARINFHSEYGNNISFTFNPFYLIKNKAKFFGNLYSAFKTPTLYQLFDPFAGNNKLNPEKGIIGELGIEIFSIKSLSTRIVGFYRNTKDAILYTYDPLTFASQYKNASHQRNYGGELEASYFSGKFSFAANYTFTDGNTKSVFDGTGTPLSKDTSYYNLYRIPKHATNFKAGINFTNDFFLSMQIRSIGKRKEYIYGSSPETLKGYTTIDLYGEYRFGKMIKLFLDLKNLTNREYFDIFGYNSRKFNFTTGVSFHL